MGLLGSVRPVPAGETAKGEAVNRAIWGRLFGVAVLALALAAAAATSAAQAAVFHSDPAPIVVKSTPGLTVLRKELNAFPNYGVADGRADILYSTESAEWTFDLSGTDLPGPVKAANVVISLVLDDHYGRPISDYVGRISVNGAELFSGGFATDLGAEHGTPFGEVFSNWTLVHLHVKTVQPGVYTVSIANDTSGNVFGDWIAIDYIDLRLNTQSG